MTRDKALMNTLTVFTYLVTYYPKRVINLIQYYGEFKITISCFNMTDQDIEDLSKQLDYLRIDGSKMSSRSFETSLDGKTITTQTLELIWYFDE